MRLSEIINDLKDYIDGLEGQIGYIDRQHQQEIEGYKERGVNYGSSVQTNYSSKVVPLRMKKDSLEKILSQLENVGDLEEDVPVLKKDEGKQEDEDKK
jgi:hypothetical protein